jgi:hypothetical protein
VNEGIAPDLCSLSYITCSIDDAANIIVKLGSGTQLLKINIKSADGMVPIHPEDCHLLGMKWEEMVYIDAALSFGLRSVTKIFTAVADAIEWIVKRDGVEHLHHYLDDFLILSEPNSEECAENLPKLLVRFESLKVPIAIDILEGPTPILTFLVFELDTVTLTIQRASISMAMRSDYVSIAVKELVPILTAGMLLGDTWHNKHVLVHCDNQAVVNSGSSKDPGLAQLLRCLFFIIAEFQISLRATHIVGCSNVQADAISRNYLYSSHRFQMQPTRHLPFLQP